MSSCWRALSTAPDQETDAVSAANTHPGRQSGCPDALRAVFISDIHLGTAGCQAEALLAFLR